jgi:phosphoenolpyruvate-protein phosphotransferase
VTGPLRGVAAAPGAAVGPAWLLEHVAERPPGTPDEERERVRAGLAAAAAELDAAAAALREKGRGEEAEILESNALMAADPMLLEAALEAIDAGAPLAERAIESAAGEQASLLESLEDPMLALRAADVRQIPRRAARALAGGGGELPDGIVIVADDLGPAEVAEGLGRIAAIALAGGGTTAHAAIVARSLGIPLVAGLGEALHAIPAGEILAVDADEGLVWRTPDPPTASRVAAIAAGRRAARERDLAERDLPAETRDGRRLRLLANAGTREEVDAALAAGAEGTGLLRSELSFLEATAWPSEAEHRAVLGPLLAPLAGRIATVRTLDFGGDKTPPFLRRPGQDPFLAPRGIRLALGDPRAVEAQLRALYAAAGGAAVRILVPMVSDGDQLDEVRELAERARAAVAPQTEPFPVGAMVEVPAAALLAGRLAEHADFLSIGTNDLIQYTLGVARLGDATPTAVAHHPAVLRLVALTVEGAAGTGIPVDVCGEAAGDPRVLPLLVGLGVDELSVSPARIGETRRQVRALSFAEAQEAARAALEVETPAEAERLARSVAGP